MMDITTDTYDTGLKATILAATAAAFGAGGYAWGVSIDKWQHKDRIIRQVKKIDDLKAEQRRDNDEIVTMTLETPYTVDNQGTQGQLNVDRTYATLLKFEENNLQNIRKDFDPGMNIGLGITGAVVGAIVGGWLASHLNDHTNFFENASHALFTKVYPKKPADKYSGYPHE